MCTWFTQLWFTQLPTSPKLFHYPHSQMRKLRSREVDQRVLGHTAGVLALEVGCLQHHLPPTSLLCSEAHHVGAESKTQSWMCVGGAHIGREKSWMHKEGYMLGGEGAACPPSPRNWEETDSPALSIQVCHPQRLEPSLQPGAPGTRRSPAAPQGDPGMAGHPQDPGQ